MGLCFTFFSFKVYGRHFKGFLSTYICIHMNSWFREGWTVLTETIVISLFLGQICKVSPEVESTVPTLMQSTLLYYTAVLHNMAGMKRGKHRYW